MPRTSSNPGQREWTVTNGESLTIDCPVDLSLAKVHNPKGDAIVLASGASGRIGYADVLTKSQDGIKVQNADARAARDFTVVRGRLVAEGRNPPDVHQDGIQVMGGARLTFLDLDIVGFAVQGVFVNTAGGGATTPTDITLRGLRVNKAGATGINIGTFGGRMVIEGCVVWASLNWGRAIIPRSYEQGNIIRPKDYPFTFRSGTAPPTTPVEPEPEPPDTGDELERLNGIIDAAIEDLENIDLQLQTVLANLRSA